MIFKSEHHLVQTFIGLVDQNYWTVYPETGNFDLLLSRKEDGFQIGVEAKISLNMKVVAQAANLRVHPRAINDPGPDCRAVLVPWKKDRNEFGDLIRALGIVVLKVGGLETRPSLSMNLPILSDKGDNWPEHFPAQRLPLPEYVPDVKAGVKGPTKLTHWKVQAIKLSVLLDQRGYLIRGDFARMKVSPSIWTQGRWLIASEYRGRWIKGPNLPDFRSQHPINYAEIEADIDRWNAFDLEGYI